MYEQATGRNAEDQHVVNLGVLYEDRGDYAKAEYVLKQVADSDPNHPRALFLKDVTASTGMFIEVELELGGPHDAVLDIPVTDFELSVRARTTSRRCRSAPFAISCGSEAELNSYKNVGDTTVTEIKQMLASKGLVGQDMSGGPRLRQEDIEEFVSRGISEQTLGMPIACSTSRFVPARPSRCSASTASANSRHGPKPSCSA